MRNVFFLFLISIFAASLALPQSAASSKKATAVKKTTSSKSTAKTSSVSGTSKTSASRKGKPVRKSSRTASAGPYRQATPTPERYREIQQALADKGYLKSEPNGVWDAQSIDALTRFQNDKKLTPTGKITSTSLIDLGLGPKNDFQKPSDATPAPSEPVPASVPPTQNP